MNPTTPGQKAQPPDPDPRPSGRGVGPDKAPDVESQADSIFREWKSAFARRDLARAARLRRDLLTIRYTITLGRPPRLRRLDRGGVA